MTATTTINSGYVNSGIALDDATLINQSTGSIISGGYGVYALNGSTNPDTAVNQGLITGVDLGAGGSLTNRTSGTITGATRAVLVQNAAGTVLNQGTLLSLGGYGVHLTDGGAVTSTTSALISGRVLIQGADGQVVNGGTIADGVGVYLRSGSVTNTGSGTILSTDIGITGDYAGFSVVNQGYVSAASAGVQVLGAGTALSSGTIVATNYGIWLTNGGVATNMAGGLITLAGIGIDLGYSAVGGTANNASGATIAAGIGLRARSSPALPATLTNTGQITASNEGIYLKGARLASNASGGTIVAPIGIALYPTGSYGTAVNGGFISASTYGIPVRTGGGGTAINGGLISSAQQGVVLQAGATFINHSGGRIEAVQAGVGGYNAPSTIINSGSISASCAVLLSHGGVVKNAAGGVIASSGTLGVLIQAGNGTVANAGTIAAANAANYAVQLAAGYANTVVLCQGASFVGTVAGGT